MDSPTNEFTLSGGLGDCIMQCFERNNYERCATECSAVIVNSHNPAAMELFKWHPGNVTATYHLFTHEAWQNGKLGDVRPQMYDRVEFFGKGFPGPLPSSFEILSPGAGDVRRSMTKCHIRRVIDNAQRQLILVGGPTTQFPAEWLSAVIDWRHISVPDTINLVARASHVHCAHSSVNIMAWMLKRPQTVYVPQWRYDIFFTERPHATDHWGLDVPGSEMVVYHGKL